MNTTYQHTSRIDWVALSDLASLIACGEVATQTPTTQHTPTRFGGLHGTSHGGLAK
jgi:hypothetical protein